MSSRLQVVAHTTSPATVAYCSYHHYYHYHYHYHYHLPPYYLTSPSFSCRPSTSPSYSTILTLASSVTCGGASLLNYYGALPLPLNLAPPLIRTAAASWASVLDLR